MEKQNIKTNKIYPKSLTSLRFFAVMFIVLHHLRIEFKPSLLDSKVLFGYSGIMGVTFFIFLSGFVITLNYSNFSGVKDSLYFMWNRIVRIYPSHIFTLFICLIMFYMWNAPVKVSTFIINILLLQSYFHLQRVFFSFNSVTWILSTLFFFYLIFSIVNHRPRYFFWVAILSALCLIASMAYIEVSSNANKLWLLYIAPPNRLLVFLFGVGSAKLLLNFYNSLKNYLGKTSATFLELISILLIIDFVLWGNLTSFLCNTFLLISFPFGKSLDFFIKHYIASSIPIFLLLVVFGLERGFISQFLTKRFFIFLGEISFSVFMFHQLFFRALKFYKKFLFATFGQSVTIIVLILLTVPLSFPIYKFIEEPIRRKLRVGAPKKVLS